MKILEKTRSARLIKTGFSNISTLGSPKRGNILEKGKPVARRGRKATGSPRGTAWLLKGGCDEPEKYSSQ